MIALIRVSAHCRWHTPELGITSSHVVRSVHLGGPCLVVWPLPRRPSHSPGHSARSRPTPRIVALSDPGTRGCGLGVPLFPQRDKPRDAMWTPAPAFPLTTATCSSHEHQMGFQ